MRGINSRNTKSKRFKQWLLRLFPERQFHLRSGGRVSYFKLSHRMQVSLVIVFVMFGSWTAFTTASFLFHDKVVAAKNNQIANARLAYRSLLREVADYQKKFTSITDDLEENHNIMLGLVQRNTVLQQNLKTVKSKLGNTENEREKIIATSVYLKNRLSEAKNEMGSLTSNNNNLKDNLEVLENDLQTALSERNQSLFKGTQMRRYIKEMETRLTNMEETEMQAVQRLTEGATTFIDNMQKVVKLAGLNVDRLLAADGGLSEGQGGPFIEAKPDGLPAKQLKANLSNLNARLLHSEALQGVMRKLPLSPPLFSYRITSGYGKRRDPINRKWGAHYGLDLGAPFKTSVYATSPGVVTFVGWKGHYGKLIEIDHGAGLKTRYGHLHKTLVKKGEKVKFQDKIGLLGNTGRSTGAHLHYEVVFKGKTRNPIKFIKAGRYVFQD
ncbi:MAG: peptidoglycan DD-metalloendopeptidase family protein [Rhodospirillales bacterium]